MNTETEPNPARNVSCDLEAVIATDQLKTRSFRQIDPAIETRALSHLTRQLARSPRNFFQILAEATIDLVRVDSAGISLLNGKVFTWPAVAGNLAHLLGQGTPADFGPCSTVLTRNAPQLFIRPERYFTYLESIRPRIEEGLLVPFYVRGTAVGTIWAIRHSHEHPFDREDLRLLQTLSEFAASAYAFLASAGEVPPTE
jgi:GAF domain-containing protein